jgi:Phage tail tube protein
MTFAQGSRTQVAYVAETTYGTTPTTPTTVVIPDVSFAVNATIDQLEDNSIRADRMQRYSLTGNTHVTGDFDVNLANHNFDPFFASLLTGQWSTNVLKFGTLAAPSFTFEVGQLDIGQYWTYTGVVVDKLALSISTTGVVTAKFTVIGKATALASSTICASPTVVTERAPFTSQVGTFKEAGAITAVFTALALTIDNQTTANFVLGSNTAANLSSGMVKATGTATVEFQDAVIANKFLAGTASTLDFTLTDGTNTLEFVLPNIKYTGAARTVSGQGPVTLAVTFTALYDATTSTVLTITRSS